MLSEQAIKEYREIMRTKCGLEVSAEEAAIQGEALIRLIEALFKPRKVGGSTGNSLKANKENKMT